MPDSPEVKLKRQLQKAISSNTPVILITVDEMDFCHCPNPECNNALGFNIARVGADEAVTLSAAEMLVGSDERAISVMMEMLRSKIDDPAMDHLGKLVKLLPEAFTVEARDYIESVNLFKETNHESA